MLMNNGGYLMQYDYYQHDAQMRMAALQQEAEHERLVREAQQGVPKFYHRWAGWLGRRTMQSGQQLVQFRNKSQTSVVIKSPHYAALPIRNTHTLKATHMLPEGKM
jgi:guanyl-specific ribonuclease Sa